LKTWNYLRDYLITTDQEFKEQDVVIALSFGRRACEPGTSNKSLAESVKRLHEKYGIPLILQKEIAFLLCSFEKAGIIKEHRKYKRNGKTKKYLDTYEVLAQAKEICKDKGWKKITLVAHQDHLPRVIRTAKKLNFTVSIFLLKNVPYDEKSIQSWTRTRWRFCLRELITTIIYRVQGKV